MPRAAVRAALLAALPWEVQPFLRRVRAQRRIEGGMPLWEFAVGQGRGVAVLAGMGEAAAARSAAWVLERYQPQVFICLGFGGAVTTELGPGAVVLGDSFWRYEPQAGTLRELPAPEPAVPLGELLKSLAAAGLPACRGSIVTTPVVIQKAIQGSHLTHLTHPALEMETSAVAAAARESRLPMLAIRAITDPAGEEIPDFIAQAAQEGRTPTPGMALAWLAADLRRFPVLARLWQRSRLAARNLAQALEVVLRLF